MSTLSSARERWLTRRCGLTSAMKRSAGPPLLVMYVRRTSKYVRSRASTSRPTVTSPSSLGPANRDPAQFADPDRFDIFREKKPHMAFGNGPHFYAGSWVAKSMVVSHALPAFFAAFRGLRLDPKNPPTQLAVSSADHSPSRPLGRLTGRLRNRPAESDLSLARGERIRRGD